MNWKPIETAPKDGTEILLVRSGKERLPSYRVAYWDDEKKDQYHWHVEDAAEGFNHHDNFPTHWMPLPDPPEH